MAETIKKQFFKQNFHKQIANFDNNWLIFKNGQVVEILFPEKMINDLSESQNF